MNTPLRYALLAAALLAAGGAQAKSHPTISKAKAETIALHRVEHGVIKSAELENEMHRQVWSFDIARHGVAGVTEVLVDAHTGKVLSVKDETPAKERAEHQQEAKEAQKH
ncbi:PepSY domain-containing protein [Lysobacter claricitrinus]|uniref:PepSY domain-containing protein n=1 Tax=Lysobacter claricitrinus TaxID=3367728 RepID=UPI0037DB7030